MFSSFFLIWLALHKKIVLWYSLTTDLNFGKNLFVHCVNEILYMPHPMIFIKQTYLIEIVSMEKNS